MTTIKVAPSLRDEINEVAQQENLTAGGLIERLLTGYQRRRRMEAFGRAFQTADQTYYDEMALWDVTLSDGLENA